MAEPRLSLVPAYPVNHRSSILLAVGEPVLRSSLRFLLEAEGFAVRCLEPLSAAAPPGVDCVVADIHDWPLVPALHGLPAVLLSGGRTAPPSGAAIRLVFKPLLGSRLTEAIRQVLAPSALAPTQIPLGG